MLSFLKPACPAGQLAATLATASIDRSLLDEWKFAEFAEFLGAKGDDTKSFMFRIGLFSALYAILKVLGRTPNAAALGTLYTQAVEEICAERQISSDLDLPWELAFRSLVDIVAVDALTLRGTLDDLAAARALAAFAKVRLRTNRETAFVGRYFLDCVAAATRGIRLVRIEW